ncbi:MAG: tetratricopeptide repeat protein [Planctomycetaceae bacterium]|jgi:tetratricopeptide (TPR) repeat protein|nr:tetratricopeptide repeat protein [Planctomycetaceae bacterium]
MGLVNTVIPRLTSFYLDYLQEHDVALFVKHANRYYNQSTIMRLAFSEQVDTRRATAMALGFLGDYGSNSVLGGLLIDVDRSVRLLAESSIKYVWPRDGSEQQRHELRIAMRNIAAHNFAEAIRVTNNLLDEKPLYAEARNQRGIALFAVGDFGDAIEDCKIVLDINPYHFGAAIGMGHAYLQLKNKELAIICFQQALQINPNLESIRRRLAKIVQNF